MGTKWENLKHKASPETRERIRREALAECAELERLGAVEIDGLMRTPSARNDQASP